MSKSRLGQRGVGLLQAGMAAAVIGGIGAAMLSSSSQQGRINKTIDFKNDAVNVTSEVAMLLSDRTACVNSIGGRSAASSVGVITGLKNEVGTVVFGTSSRYGVSGLSFHDFELRDEPGLADGVEVVPGAVGSTNMVIHFKELKGSFYDTRRYQTKLRLSVTTDAGGNILSCMQVGDGSRSLWARQTGSPDNILYDRGAVGIGTNTPTELLEVVGTASARNDDGDYIAIGATASEFRLDLEANHRLDFLQAPGGFANVQAGQVDARGAVKLANPGAACNATTEGALRYHAPKSMLQFCNGTYWLTVQQL